MQSPITETPENLARGKQVYDTICTVCHGTKGEGDGPESSEDFRIRQTSWRRTPRAFPTVRLVHIISRGQIMPSHAAQVLLEDRWRVVMYLRQMQGGQTGATVASGAPEPAPAEAVVHTPGPVEVLR